MANSADPDQLASSARSRSQLIWIYTVCKGREYPGSAGQGLKPPLMVLLLSSPVWYSCSVHLCFLSFIFVRVLFCSFRVFFVPLRYYFIPLGYCFVPVAYYFLPFEYCFISLMYCFVPLKYCFFFSVLFCTCSVLFCSFKVLFVL